MLSQRVRKIGPSPTLAIAALAERMRAEGLDVLDFSAGQPDFKTPERVKAAGVSAIVGNQTRYTPTAGLPALREAIAARVTGKRGVECTAAQVLVSPGAKASLYFACLALIEAGDEVLVPAPYWISHPEQVRLAGGRPVFVNCEEANGFKLAAEQVDRAATSRTRGLILNYPANPTGACYSREELEALAAVCLRRGLWVIADEIYSQLLYDGRRFTSIAAVSEEMRQRTMIIDGMSKTWSMTGWRVGYAVGPPEWIAGMSRLQDHVTSCATTISQWASLEALALPDEEIEPRTHEFSRRRDALVDALARIPGISCIRPAGAFYALPNVSGLFGGALNSGEDVARHLLDQARVAVVPGEAFGSARHIRLSFATSIETIERGIERIAAALTTAPRTSA